MKPLPNAYDVGKVQYVHAGFRVHKTIGKFNKPMEPVGKIHDSPEAALKVLDELNLGHGYAVFRVMQSKNGYEPRESIDKNELPVHVVNYVGPPRNKRTPRPT